MRKDVERLRKLLVFHLEKVICVIFAGRCVLLSVVGSQKLAVMIFVWILLGSQEKHVFTKMSETIHVRRVLQTAHIHVETSRRLPSVRIVDQEAIQVV